MKKLMIIAALLLGMVSCSKQEEVKPVAPPQIQYVYLHLIIDGAWDNMGYQNIDYSKSGLFYGGKAYGYNLKVPIGDSVDVKAIPESYPVNPFTVSVYKTKDSIRVWMPDYKYHLENLIPDVVIGPTDRYVVKRYYVK